MGQRPRPHCSINEKVTRAVALCIESYLTERISPGKTHPKPIVFPIYRDNSRREGESERGALLTICDNSDNSNVFYVIVLPTDTYFFNAHILRDYWPKEDRPVTTLTAQDLDQITKRFEGRSNCGRVPLKEQIERRNGEPRWIADDKNPVVKVLDDFLGSDENVTDLPDEVSADQLARILGIDSRLVYSAIRSLVKSNEMPRLAPGRAHCLDRWRQTLVMLALDDQGVPYKKPTA